MKQIFTIFSFLLCSLYFVQSFGQASPRFILYYKPYTDSSETNLYRDTVIKFDLNTQYENIKNADIEKDVEIAILNKDYRIVGISGNSYLFPGLENKKKKIKF